MLGLLLVAGSAEESEAQFIAIYCDEGFVGASLIVECWGHDPYPGGIMGGCWHDEYFASVEILSPTGRWAGGDGEFWASAILPVNGEAGWWTGTGLARFMCACGGLMEAGGGWPIQVSPPQLILSVTQGGQNVPAEVGKATHRLALTDTGDVLVQLTAIPSVNPAAVQWSGGLPGANNFQRIVPTGSASISRSVWQPAGRRQSWSFT